MIYKEFFFLEKNRKPLIMVWWLIVDRLAHRFITQPLLRSQRFHDIVERSIHLKNGNFKEATRRRDPAVSERM